MSSFHLLSCVLVEDLKSDLTPACFPFFYSFSKIHFNLTVQITIFLLYPEVGKEEFNIIYANTFTYCFFEKSALI